MGGAAREAAIVGPDDPDFEGGSYVVVQKYLHDLTSWNALTVEEQERVIGRTKLDDVEFPDDEKAADSHLALNTIVENGAERDIVRRTCRSAASSRASSAPTTSGTPPIPA